MAQPGGGPGGGPGPVPETAEWVTPADGAGAHPPLMGGLFRRPGVRHMPLCHSVPVIGGQSPAGASAGRPAAAPDRADVRYGGDGGR